MIYGKTMFLLFISKTICRIKKFQIIKRCTTTRGAIKYFLFRIFMHFDFLLIIGKVLSSSCVASRYSIRASISSPCTLPLLRVTPFPAYWPRTFLVFAYGHSIVALNYGLALLIFLIWLNLRLAHYFANLKKHLGGMKFPSNEAVQVAVNEYFESLEESFFKPGIVALETR